MKAEITSFNSSFFEYLCGFVWFDQERLEALMKRYPIGATEQGEPIFWHINSEHKITNGRILTMDRETGKVYDASWYYQDKRPTCLFGEYLLDSFPTRTVALVTDEMTAAIMSCFPTPYVWLKQNFPLRYFYGESANAIKIQVWVTLIANLLMTLLQKRLTRPWNFSGLATMVRIVLMYYINMDTFFERPDEDLKLLLKQTAEEPREEENLK